MSEKIKERLKSKIVWLAILAQVVLIVTLFNPSVANEIKIVSTSLIEMATLIGVLNNPSDKEEF